MKLTVKARLFISFGLSIIIMICLGIYANYNLQRINGYSLEIAGSWLPGVEIIQTVETLATDYRTQEYHYITAGDNIEKAQAEQSMSVIHRQIDENLAAYKKTIGDENNRKIFSEITASLGSYMDESMKAISLDKQGLDADAIRLLGGQSQDAFNILSANIASEVKYNKDSGISVSQEGEKVYRRANFALSVAIIIAALFGLGLAYFISRSINNPLKKLEGLAKSIAEGDLTVEDAVIKNRDEIGSLGEAFNIMKNNLRDIITRLASTTADLSGMAQELAGQAQQTSAAATESAATVGEIAATMDLVAQNAQEVASLSGESSSEAARGSQDVDRVSDRMQEISAASNEASGVVDSLSNTLGRVNQIVELITGIADQTNLLALNAAIEAARAGEQGRGFAVVAEEVRKLAEQSASAAGDIGQLIGKVDAESRKAVAVMSESNERVREGVTVIGEVGTRFKGIIDRIETLAGQVQNVAASAEQVSTGVQNVSASTEEQTAAMEEVSAATEQLNKMAFDLSELAKKFRL